jgi:hypothetical protein
MNAIGQKPENESITAGVTIDTTPRVGVVLSSFAGGEEHDGTPLPGLREPCLVDADLTPRQRSAMLAKAIELGTPRRRGGLANIVDSMDWLLVLAAPLTESELVVDLLDWLAERRCGKRITIAGMANHPEIALQASARRPEVRVELLDLRSCERLKAPSPTRAYAAHNPEGVYSLPRAFRSCDRLIAMSPLQVDSRMGVALTAAAYLELAPEREVRSSGSAEEVLTDIFAQHPADYAIAGGSWVYDADGPRVRHNLIVAGTRATAVDAVSTAIMGFDPKKLRVLTRLERRGFGVRDLDSIWTRGNEIEQAALSVLKPQGWRE